MKFLHWLYSVSLYAYPREFRKRFGPEMRQLFRDRCRETWTNPTCARISALLFGTARDWVRTSIQERFVVMLTYSKLAYAAAILFALLAVPVTVLRAYVISGGSMEGTLQIGDHLIVNKLVGNVHRGDLVVFPSPVDPQARHSSNAWLAFPATTSASPTKQVFRNGQPLVEMPYASHVTNYFDPRPRQFSRSGRRDCSAGNALRSR